MVAGRIVLMF